MRFLKSTDFWREWLSMVGHPILDILFFKWTSATPVERHYDGLSGWFQLIKIWDLRVQHGATTIFFFHVAWERSVSRALKLAILEPRQSDSFVHFSTRRQLVMVIQIPRVWCAKSWRRNGSHESRCCFVPCMEMGRYGKIIRSTEMIWNWFRQNSYDLAIWLCSKAGQLSAETNRIFCDSPSGHCYWKGITMSSP